MFNAGTLIICILAAFAFGWILGEWKSEIRYHRSVMKISNSFREEIAYLVQKIKALESDNRRNSNGNEN